MNGRCHNCSRNAMYVVGDDDEQFPLCLDCYVRWEDIHLRLSGSGQPKHRREIIEGKDHTDAIKALRIEYRLDEALREATDVLSVHPEIFPCVPQTNLYRLAINEFHGVPALNIWFVFDDHQVTLIAVDLADLDY